jgi:hypothetical protein
MYRGRMCRLLASEGQVGEKWEEKYKARFALWVCRVLTVAGAAALMLP